MGRRKPKTQGLEWLKHSLGAFNGSGYADMDSSEAFLSSYVTYKTMHKKLQAVELAKQHREEALLFLDNLLAKTYGAGRKPAQKYLNRFEAFKNQTQTGLF